MRCAPTSPEDLKQTNRFSLPQDQIQWGILVLSEHLRRLSVCEREQSLQDLWECARQRGDLLRLQIIRDYREDIRRLRFVCHDATVSLELWLRSRYGTWRFFRIENDNVFEIDREGRLLGTGPVQA